MQMSLIGNMLSLDSHRKLAVSGVYETSPLRPDHQVASIILVFTHACVTLTILPTGLSQTIQALLDSGV